MICGIGYHHAGLDPTDRRNIEAMFIKGDIPVLCKYNSVLPLFTSLPTPFPANQNLALSFNSSCHKYSCSWGKLTSLNPSPLEYTIGDIS